MTTLLKSKKGQLYLIEVLVALGVIIVMMVALISFQVKTPPVDVDSSLEHDIMTILIALDEQDLLTNYIKADNEDNNASKTALGKSIEDTFRTQLPLSVQYNGTLFRYESVISGITIWETRDSLNSISAPEGMEIYSVEYLIPGYDSTLITYRIIIQAWYLGGI
jgi:type II secretory pathway pseudopilin PulG